MYLGNGVGPQGTTETERHDKKSSYSRRFNHEVESLFPNSRIVSTIGNKIFTMI